MDHPWLRVCLRVVPERPHELKLPSELFYASCACANHGQFADIRSRFQMATQGHVRRDPACEAIYSAEYCQQHVYVFLCASACLSAKVSPEQHVQSLPNFLCTLPVAMALFSSVSVAIRYALPVLRITSRSGMRGAAAQLPGRRGGCGLSSTACRDDDRPKRRSSLFGDETPFAFARAQRSRSRSGRIGG